MCGGPGGSQGLSVNRQSPMRGCSGWLMSGRGKPPGRAIIAIWPYDQARLLGDFRQPGVKFTAGRVFRTLMDTLRRGGGFLTHAAATGLNGDPAGSRGSDLHAARRRPGRGSGAEGGVLSHDPQRGPSSARRGTAGGRGCGFGAHPATGRLFLPWERAPMKRPETRGQVDQAAARCGAGLAGGGEFAYLRFLGIRFQTGRGDELTGRSLPFDESLIGGNRPLPALHGGGRSRRAFLETAGAGWSWPGGLDLGEGGMEPRGGAPPPTPRWPRNHRHFTGGDLPAPRALAPREPMARKRVNRCGGAGPAIQGASMVEGAGAGQKTGARLFSQDGLFLMAAGRHGSGEGLRPRGR